MKTKTKLFGKRSIYANANLIILHETHDSHFQYFLISFYKHDEHVFGSFWDLCVFLPERPKLGSHYWTLLHIKRRSADGARTKYPITVFGNEWHLIWLLFVDVNESHSNDVRRTKPAYYYYLFKRSFNKIFLFFIEVCGEMGIFQKNKNVLRFQFPTKHHKCPHHKCHKESIIEKWLLFGCQAKWQEKKIKKEWTIVIRAKKIFVIHLFFLAFVCLLFRYSFIINL